ncbi:hypothetical protein N802_06055 [Knoellia sinensis KCTC 19936]|uniref:N-acetyltransferase domain-containing protein n=1 Tax=Knoellia sinensis KCTC 19936 TaxID=1385520 RepID=A0A0A0J0Z1_9MICO|nr:GNAT family N-acetyltransferase [Knoellia sinensis]KGN30768.1 hypothetical protein N802_06055 [Knoellia sinensis KCTC 19936]
MGGQIRDASGQDAERCAEIFSTYVTAGTSTLETHPPTRAEMAERISAATREHAWLVLEDEGYVVGFAQAGPYREGPAQRYACEVAIWVEPGRHGTGGAKRLHTALLSRLSRKGFTRAFAFIPLPNVAAVGLHEALGFIEVGVHTQVGWKHGSWRDALWMQRAIGPVAVPPDDSA